MIQYNLARLRSMPANQAYRDGWDRTFGGRLRPRIDWDALCMCGHPRSDHESKRIRGRGLDHAQPGGCTQCDCEAWEAWPWSWKTS